MSHETSHRWTFVPRFRKGAFGWRSQPAIIRIREALSEIKKMARKNPILGAEGSILFLEKISAAIANVDGSSGAIGAEVNAAVDVLVAIIARAPADEALRGKWLDRLRQIHPSKRLLK
jgi:hypothetical protein